MAQTPKALIITEKPSVARDVVAALGGFTAAPGQTHWESPLYVCTYAIGHLVEFLEPHEIDPAYKRWSLSSLPIIPRAFQRKATAGHEKRLKIIGELMARPDVGSLVNACDAAREGELIFRELVVFHGCRKWVRRLWLQSMTPEAIRAGFTKLRDGTDLEGLGDAAECRAKSDWLIGMNATRAFSKRLQRIIASKDESPWSVGRVQTPTLALLVEREIEILGHQPRPFFRLLARFAAPDHEYEGMWFDPLFRKNEAKTELRDDRLQERSRVDEIVEKTSGQPGTASETREESLRHAPYLFNLTGLQKYMSQRFKWSSKRTLEAAQRCYETHKVLTYPRTSSSALPSDYKPEVRRLIDIYASRSEYGEAAQFLISNGLKNEKRTFDDKAVTDHFAIIPTGRSASLSGDDARLFDAVVRRFLATFHPPAIYDKVKRTTVVAGESFRTGPLETLVVPGWLSVYGKDADDDKAVASKSLPPLVPGKKRADGVGVKPLAIDVKEELTKPPQRISEAGLLGLMENAGRQVENEELATALMTAEGLGTAATRADIIQNLKSKRYVDEQLRPTVKGIHLITILRRIRAERLTSPELTARLELELSEVEAGRRTERHYMNEIERYVSEVVETAKTFDLDRLYPDTDPVGTCPTCKGSVYERVQLYECGAGCGFRVWKDAFGRYVERNSAEVLLRDGSTAVLDGFRSQSGKEQRARLEIQNGRVCVVGDTDGAIGLIEGPVDANGGDDRPRAGASARSGSAGARNAVAICPIHVDSGCQVVETRNGYVCETRLKEFAAQSPNPTGVFLPKILCKKELTPALVKILMKNGVTPVINDFVSKAGKPFSAKLKLAAAGSVDFEFVSASSANRRFNSKESEYE